MPSDKAEDARVFQQELFRLRVRLSRAIFAFAALCVFVFCVVALAFAAPVREVLISLRVYAVMVPIVCASVALPGALPSLVTEKTIDAWHIYMQVLFGVSVSPWIVNDSKIVHHFLWPYASIFSFVSCLVNLRTSVSIFTNAAFAVFLMWTSSLVSDGPDEQRDFQEAQVFILVAKVAVTMVLELCLRSQADVVAGHQLEKRALLSLLRMVCDTVMRLDEQGKIQKEDQHSEGKSCYYLGKPIEGHSILELLQAEDDRKRLQRAIRNTADTPPTVVHGTLCDLLGAFVRMQFYIVPFVTTSGMVHHIVACKEDAEQTASSMGTPMDDDLSVVLEHHVTCDELEVLRKPRGKAAKRVFVRADELCRCPVQTLDSESDDDFNEQETEQMIVEIEIQADLPIVMVGERLKRKYGEFKAGESALAAFPSDGAELAEWVISTDAAVCSGAKRPGRKSFGFVKVGSAARPRREVIAMFQAQCVGGAEPRRVLLRIGRLEPGWRAAAPCHEAPRACHIADAAASAEADRSGDHQRAAQPEPLRL
eukprot:CAMPEP_0176141346 /NCGR_PEP_ID=MMETSP0120_2-20121206/71871_1 /TAXON_ID=160619 /ORGANISM="Kryptoperidinium foliaceum, Strain CCMP 1326" /LENGTH=536 /DNA_ID=CAMNT_0017477475 /DNA_START=55 /DNA_END=1665 /DNA_ORIENTATION=+